MRVEDIHRHLVRGAVAVTSQIHTTSGASAELCPLCLPVSLVLWTPDQGKGRVVQRSQSCGFFCSRKAGGRFLSRKICICQISNVLNAFPKFTSRPFCPKWPLCWDMLSLLIRIKSLLKHQDEEAQLFTDKVCAANSPRQSYQCIFSIKPCGPK